MGNILLRMSEIKDLSPSERHVVDYILEHCQEACHMGIVELGEKTFTSPTTVKRLCRKLGVASYTNFRMQLNAAQSQYTSEGIFRAARTPVLRGDTPGEVLEKVSRQSAAAILESCQLVDTQALSQVVELMASASRMDFYGTGPACVVAWDGRQKCMRLKIRSAALCDRASMLMSARNSDRRTLAFLISCGGGEDDVIEAAQELRAHQAATVALTVTPDDLLGRVCRYALGVDSGQLEESMGGMSSCIAALNLTGALFTALVNTDYDRYTRNIAETRVDSRGRRE